MGAYLDKPKTEKHMEIDGGNDLRVGMCEMQGWRSHMEDAHIMHFHIPNIPNATLLGVFDGHGGAYIAGKIKEEGGGLFNDLKSTPALMNSGDKTPAEIGSSLREAFLKFDTRLKPMCADIDDRSGATATSVIITESHIICANAGDSRTVLGRDNRAFPLSVDHKPDDTPEKNRIEAAGGSVMMSRVNGDLAVSRALGDFSYKGNSEVPDIAQMVSPEPDIHIEERSEKDQLVVLACDGIWDVMTNIEVVEFILENHMKHPDLGYLGAALINECLNRNSRDNMTICICLFPGLPEPSVDDKARMYEEIRVAEEERRQAMSENSK